MELLLVADLPLLSYLRSPADQVAAEFLFAPYYPTKGICSVPRNACLGERGRLEYVVLPIKSSVSSCQMRKMAVIITIIILLMIGMELPNSLASIVTE